MPTILYAEDDSEHRIMMRMIMKKTDFTLVEAHNGQEVLQKIQYQRPDLILLDLFMPKVDGYAVMDALKANPETKNIPIIILSAWPTVDSRKRTKQAGAIDFIAKPYDPFELLKTIRLFLTNQT